jgi:hypothetical protein
MTSPNYAQQVQYGQDRDFEIESKLEDKLMTLLNNINMDIASGASGNIEAYKAEAKTLLTNVEFFVRKYQLSPEKYEAFANNLNESLDLQGLSQFLIDVSRQAAHDFGVALGFRAQRQPKGPWEDDFLGGSKSKWSIRKAEA